MIVERLEFRSECGCRYQDDNGMHTSIDGEFVCYSDFRALEDRLKEAEDAIDETNKMLKDSNYDLINAGLGSIATEDYRTKYPKETT